MKRPTALVGATVERVAFDWQTRLLLVARNPDTRYRVNAELVIETPFVLRDADGLPHELEPGTGSAQSSMLDLFTKTITDLHIGDRGALTLHFDNGAQLSIDPHPGHESWNLAGTGIDGILIGPGGETDWAE
ncbi:DUF6188 family protein [Nocardia aurantia]|uniref:Uncharacterized protein n=1 Tax=Nocardia aurantia TaxID=2585199 RepID=A0A7K0DIN3_9NOCA|nr:DUF6188 family protein [Nocardia aurantia]MQY25508.1 hypothetical protein [Nocardia aurantia]